MAIHPPIDAATDGADSERPGGPRPVSFEELWEHHGFVRDLSLSIVGDLATAEDIAQDTILRAFTHRHRIGTSQPIRNWLSVVARNRAYDELRRRKRQAVPVEHISDAAWEGPDPQQAVLLTERVDQAFTAFTALNGRERKLLRERVVRETSLDELAALDGSSIASVRSVLSRARTKLVKSIESAGGYVVAPWLGLGRRLRRLAERANAKIQTIAQGVPGTYERLAEIVVGTTVTTAAIAAALAPTPALALANVPPRSPSQAHISDARETGERRQAEDPPRAIQSAGPTDLAALSSRPAVNQTPPPPAPQPSPSQPVTPGPPQSGVPEDMPITNPLGPDPDRFQQPEDTSIYQLYVAPSGSSPESTDVFAWGHANSADGCWDICDVLFHSPDGGATWERKEAWGWNGGNLAISPTFSQDRRVYAGGSGGLSVSLDGGHSFVPIPGAQAPNDQPVLDISPAFSRGDPRVFVSDNHAAWVHDANQGLTSPFAGATPGLWSAPAFAFDPSPDAEGRYFAVAMVASPQQAAAFLNAAVTHTANAEGWGWAGSPAEKPALFSCRASTCERLYDFTEFGLYLDVYAAVRPSGGLALFVSSRNGLFTSLDGGHSFARVRTDSWAIANDGSGTLFSASPEGVLRSSDAGTTWARLGAGTPLAATGAKEVEALPGGRVIAVARGSGSLDETIWCSADGGDTWAPRCPA